MARSRQLLPKAHLHLHFTGSMRHATLLELAERDGIPLPDSLVEEWPPELSAADEKGWFRFQRLYDVARGVLRTEGDVRRLVLEAAEDDVRDGGRWLEIQVDPSGYAARFGGITAFTDLVLDAVADASRRTGLGMAVVIAANRTRHPLDARTLARLAAQYAGRGVVGFGLSNDERRGVTADFAGAFAIAGRADLLLVPHGGELRGPDHIRLCLDTLHPGRLGHGVRVRRGPAAAGRDRRRAASPSRSARSRTSRSGVYSDLTSVPLPQLLDAGATVALGADDPLLFGSRLGAQYATMRAAHELTDDAARRAGPDVVPRLARTLGRGRAWPRRHRRLAGLAETAIEVASIRSESARWGDASSPRRTRTIPTPTPTPPPSGRRSTAAPTSGPVAPTTCWSTSPATWPPGARWTWAAARGPTPCGWRTGAGPSPASTSRRPPSPGPSRRPSGRGRPARAHPLGRRRPGRPGLARDRRAGRPGQRLLPPDTARLPARRGAAPGGRPGRAGRARPGGRPRRRAALGRHPRRAPGRLPTPDGELADLDLAAEAWEVLVADVRERPATGPDGEHGRAARQRGPRPPPLTSGRQSSQPTRTGSLTSRMPYAASTPSRTSRASASRSAVVAPPRLVSARVCLVDSRARPSPYPLREAGVLDQPGGAGLDPAVRLRPGGRALGQRPSGVDRRGW